MVGGSRRLVAADRASFTEGCVELFNVMSSSYVNNFKS